MMSPVINVTHSFDLAPPSPTDADQQQQQQGGKRKFATFLIASISVYACLGVLLLVCIAVVWRRRRRLKAAAAAASAAATASAAAASSSPDELQQHEEMLLCKGGRGGGSDHSDGASSGHNQQRLLNPEDLQLSRQIHTGHTSVLFQAAYQGRACAAKLFWPDSATSLSEYRSELAAYRHLELAAAAAKKSCIGGGSSCSGMFFFPELLDSGLYAEQPCLLLELAECGSLADQLATRCYSWAEFCRLACGLCAALAQLHSLGRVHCRLETAAFALRGPLSPLLVGLSGSWASSGGHLRYAAPEMLAQSQHKHRSGSGKFRSSVRRPSGGGSHQRLHQLTKADCYSLGLILWELATRCSAFYPSGASPDNTNRAAGSSSVASSVPPYAPVFADCLPPGVRRPSLQQVCRALLTLSPAAAAASAAARRPPSLPVQNHPALPFIAETLAECWSSEPATRPSPVSLHSRFSSLAPNFV